MFVDEARIEVRSGDGGDGLVAFRREKFVPRGGPTGGDGGRGGDVVFVATNDANTLMDFRHRAHVRAEHGRPGGPQNRTGKSGKHAVIKVPVGTLVYDDETDELIADLCKDGQRVVIARGGDGGLGNQHFATSRNRVPQHAKPGFPGQTLFLRLELKLLADAGLVGYPSVGKSTLIAAMSNARPKIAAYPFTTLTPNLGVVPWRDFKEYVIADIPGLIEGAHEGLGLGIQFLKHVERTNVIVHVLEVVPQLEDQPTERDPIHDYEALCHELEMFNPELLDRPQLIVLNKIDLPHAAARVEALRAYFEDKLGLEFIAISAAAHEHLDTLRLRLGEIVYEQKALDTAGLDDDTAALPDDGREWWEIEGFVPGRVTSDDSDDSNDLDDFEDSEGFEDAEE